MLYNALSVDCCFSFYVYLNDFLIIFVTCVLVTCVYFCSHFLRHEDLGMMDSFLVSGALSSASNSSSSLGSGGSGSGGSGSGGSSMDESSTESSVVVSVISLGVGVGVLSVIFASVFHRQRTSRARAVCVAAEQEALLVELGSDFSAAGEGEDALYR
jgi:hypothetical protein